MKTLIQNGRIEYNVEQPIRFDSGEKWKKIY
jgi:hypothetical protein